MGGKHMRKVLIISMILLGFVLSALNMASGQMDLLTLLRSPATYQGQAFRDGQVRNFTVSFSTVTSDRIEGTMTWMGLGETNAITGRLVGNQLAFQERRIVAGGHEVIYCYDLRYESGPNRFAGNWLNTYNRCCGDVAINVTPPPVVVTPTPPPVVAPPTPVTFEGEVVREKQANVPFTITYTIVDPATGELEGTVEWPTLGTVTRIEGRSVNNVVTFREVGYVQRGRAPLGRSYRVTYSPTTGRYEGIWFMDGTPARERVYFE
jgi:hypothetical protein